jgi:hypothetical protein
MKDRQSDHFMSIKKDEKATRLHAVQNGRMIQALPIMPYPMWYDHADREYDTRHRNLYTLSKCSKARDGGEDHRYTPEALAVTK